MCMLGRSAQPCQLTPQGRERVTSRDSCPSALYNLAVPQPRNHTAQKPHCLTAPQSNSPTVSHLHSPTVPQTHSPTVPQLVSDLRAAGLPGMHVRGPPCGPVTQGPVTHQERPTAWLQLLQRRRRVALDVHSLSLHLHMSQWKRRCDIGPHGDNQQWWPTTGTNAGGGSRKL